MITKKQEFVIRGVDAESQETMEERIEPYSDDNHERIIKIVLEIYKLMEEKYSGFPEIIFRTIEEENQTEDFIKTFNL